MENVTWRRAAAGGAAAALAAALTMAAARSAAQVRSMPERLVEWALLFVPPELFGAVLGLLGFETKRYALYGAIAVSLAALSAIGAAALRRGCSRTTLTLLGPALWLVAMVVLMPL